MNNIALKRLQTLFWFTFIYACAMVALISAMAGMVDLSMWKKAINNFKPLSILKSINYLAKFTIFFLCLLIIAFWTLSIIWLLIIDTSSTGLFEIGSYKMLALLSIILLPVSIFTWIIVVIMRSKLKERTHMFNRRDS